MNSPQPWFCLRDAWDLALAYISILFVSSCCFVSPCVPVLPILHNHDLAITVLSMLLLLRLSICVAVLPIQVTTSLLLSSPCSCCCVSPYSSLSQDVHLDAGFEPTAHDWSSFKLDQVANKTSSQASKLR